MHQTFFKDNVRVQRVMNAVAAGTTDQTSSAVDMAGDVGFDECTFLAAFGVLTANQVTSIRVQQSDDDGSADAYGDILGSASSALADADGTKMLAITVRPQKRYLKLIIDRATANAVIDGVFAFLSKPRKLPVSQPATIISWETSDFPAEGTA